MNIQLQNLIPRPIVELGTDNSEVWGVENLTFLPNVLYLISASSGRGKTSLLSTIYGIRKDYNGTLLIDDKNAQKFSPNDWAELRINKMSYVFQGLDLFSQFTVLENIALKNDLTAKKTTAEIIDLAKQLDIESLLNRKAGILSFGQRQRVSIIRALCQPFAFLLLDEPFSHLDSENADKALKMIVNEVKSQNASMILTSLGEQFDFEFDRTVRL